MARAQKELAIFNERYGAGTDDLLNLLCSEDGAKDFELDDHKCTAFLENLKVKDFKSYRSLQKNIKKWLKLSDRIDLCEADTIETQGYLLFLNAAKSFKNLLLDATDRDIVLMLDEIYFKKMKVQDEQAEIRDQSAFFSAGAAEADLTLWSAMKVWTPEEAVALSFGKNPHKVKPDNIMPYRKVARSIFTETFEKRLLVLHSAISAGELVKPLTPFKLLRWANDQEVFKHHLLERFISKGSNEKIKHSDDEINIRTAKNLWDLFLVLLIVGYNYKLEEAVGDRLDGVYGDLQKDLNSVGVHIHPQTLRTYVKAARDKASKDKNFRSAQLAELQRIRETRSQSRKGKS